MKAFEKIKERLEEQKKIMLEAYETSTWTPNKIGFHSCASAYKDAIEIVNQVAEECNGGWIPCSERLPEDSDIYEVTAQFVNGKCYTEFAYCDLIREEWWKHDDDGLVNVIAWREHPALYQPKGEK